MSRNPVQHMRQPSIGAASRIYSRENVGRYAERARQRRRSRRIRRALVSTFIILLLCTGSALAITVVKSIINGSLHGSSGYLSGLAGILTDANAARDPFNILLLGTDGRPGETTYRSDSIILAHVDPVKKTAALISIPRDTAVEYKGETMKINETHAYGGPEAVVTAVRDLTGSNIAYYAEVSFTGLESLVDAVGGIDITVPEGDEVDDPQAGDMSIPAGSQHMDGATALTFSRARHQFADGDYTRMRHQRMVLGALAHKILNGLEITQIPALLESLSNMLITTMDVDDIVGVVTAMRGMDTSNIWSANLPSYTGADTFVDGKSYVFVYKDALREMMERVEAGEDPKGPNTSGKGGTSTTLGDLNTRNNLSWANSGDDTPE
ncbi:LCP family protein [Collinsella sp. AGMB00827]|uniref:LCP family protein n=1 Tax=Collinsella ureilytica TaxID=2869515 RepID=A0ABS7MJX5_9ACTN|nr:LCP family protein [Collinsella urealyticum]MBY4797582.1 LCP family protein [Collinsella urealyticum]